MRIRRFDLKIRDIKTGTQLVLALIVKNYYREHKMTKN